MVHFHAAMAQHNDSMRWHLATAMVMVGAVALAGGTAILYLFWDMYGLKGPLGLTVMGGGICLAIVSVKRWLDSLAATDTPRNT